MSATVHRSAKSERQTPFYRDLASPISAHRGRFATPGQAAAVSALWRDNLGGLEPPPPPVFTLDERADFSPENGLAEMPLSPEFKSETKTPSPVGVSPSPLKSRVEASTSGAVFTGESPMSQQQQPPPQTPGISSWWSPAKSIFVDHGEKGKGSPVAGVVQPGALITLPPPREVARPELQRNSVPTGNLDEEEWVTVYGFSPSDTNLVLREFEKCGVILKHVPGPRDANWIHILYQNRYDAQKALSKNGMQINSVLIVGVKLVDATERRFLDEKLNSSTQVGFMVPLLPPASSGRSASAQSPLTPSSRPYYLQSSTATVFDSGRRSGGAIATPAKSVVSKVMDLMFGI